MNRKDFIIKGGLASTAILSSGSILANHLNNYKKKVNIAVIGTGNRGGGLIGFINQIEHLNLIACCDILPFRLEEALKKTNNTAIGYSDYQKLLANKKIDAVLIATPFSTHERITIEAIKAGKHVYCEKTLAKGYEGIQELVQQVKKSNIIFQTGHQYHSSRLYLHVIDLIKKGKVGKIASVESQWNRKGDWRRKVSDPSLEKAINWRMYKEFSGGLTAELCSHQIDFVNTILNATPIQVMGAGGIDYWKDGRETYDNVHLLYTYPEGVKAKYTCLTSNAKDGYQIKVIGDKGTIILTTNTANFYPIPNNNKKQDKKQEVDGVSGATKQSDNYEYGEPINIVHEDPSKQALIDFSNSILNNKQPISSVFTGAKAAVCVQMALDAMYNNKIVPWPKHISL